MFPHWMEMPDREQRLSVILPHLPAHGCKMDSWRSIQYEQKQKWSNDPSFLIQNIWVLVRVHIPIPKEIEWWQHNVSFHPYTIANSAWRHITWIAA